MNSRFVVISADHFGVGETLAEASKNERKACGCRRVRKGEKIIAYRFDSPLPFVAVSDVREATKDESDAWVGRDGSMSWIRCSRVKLDPETGNPIDVADTAALPLDERFDEIRELHGVAPVARD